ncbi:hypothetical protein H4R24_004481 [Coemansia sp. RSA 988]|nr:hypothetical protein H4R24_004481 [Coemansia sp. RSA 988]
MLARRLIESLLRQQPRQQRLRQINIPRTAIITSRSQLSYPGAVWCNRSYADRSISYARSRWLHESRNNKSARDISSNASPYYRNEPGQLSSQPSNMDQPYPSTTEDGYYTISFYSFFDIPESRLQSLRDKIQYEWDSKLNIVGRIYIYDQGINAQLSIPAENVQKLRMWLEENYIFVGRIPRFNWAIDHRRAFKSLHVRVRPLVATDIPLSMETLRCEPEYLQPDEWEQQLRDLGEDALLVDMRNNYEYRIGRFENAVCPDVDTFREEMTVVRDMCKTRSRDQPIYMYCTGGIRCSIAGAILKSEGHSNVKTLQGGVIAYGKYVRENRDNSQSSIYRGKNFTFDKRLGEVVTSEVLTKCDQCGGECDTFTNCANNSCNLLFVQCSTCAEKHHRTCGNELCVERAQMSHEERVKDRMGSIWNYHLRVRPNKVFDKHGIAQPNRQ